MPLEEENASQQSVLSAVWKSNPGIAGKSRAASGRNPEDSSAEAGFRSLLSNVMPPSVSSFEACGGSFSKYSNPEKAAHWEQRLERSFWLLAENPRLNLQTK